MGKERTKIIRVVKKFENELRGKYQIEKIIIFGSQARGEAKKDSDIDLIVVSKNIKNKMKFLSGLYHEWHLNQKIDYPVDFLCYTPEEFEKKSKQITIVREAVKEGIVI